MSLILARIISFLTNPIFIIVPIPFLLVHYATNNTVYAVKWTLFSMGFLLIVGLIMLYSVRNKIFTDLDVSKREQRPLLFFIVTLVAISYLFALYFFRGPSVLYIALLGILAGISLVVVVNTRIKASLHVATITATFLTLGIMYNLPPLLAIAIPVIAWARVKTKRHTIEEAVIGGSVGAALILLMYFVVKYILGRQI